MFESKNTESEILVEANRFLNEQTSLKDKGKALYGRDFLAVNFFKDEYSDNYFFCFQHAYEAESIKLLDIPFTRFDIIKIAHAEQFGSEEFDILKPIFDYINKNLDAKEVNKNEKKQATTVLTQRMTDLLSYTNKEDPKEFNAELIQHKDTDLLIPKTTPANQSPSQRLFSKPHTFGSNNRLKNITIPKKHTEMTL